MQIYRTVFKKDIICEFAIPEKKSNKVIILAGGMPTVPSKKERIEKLCKLGYWIFFPRFRGTWESSGKFLQKSPHLDIKDVIDEIHKPFTELWDNKKIKIQNPQIYLIGTSFGGPAVILNSKDKRVKKAVAIAPVIDWTKDSKVEPMNKLGRFVKQAFGQGYRFDMKNWNNLAKGKFYNPITEIDKVDAKKLWIFHALDDDVVPVGPTINFAKITRCKLTLIKKGSHGICKTVLKKKKYLRAIKKYLN
ncbi:prolyl oligopeptidase family serine peptidase [Candidatus Pacearchaeota archaeon]|nr:prolyl oligopeptidase family serine peptidase [Candidatus Pacearchaeota archaeon]